MQNLQPPSEISATDLLSGSRISVTRSAGTGDSVTSDPSNHSPEEEDESRGNEIRFLEDPATANEEEVTKLRNRRKNARKRYWDTVLRIVQESERPQAQDETAQQEKLGESGDPYSLSEFAPTNFQEWLAKAKQTLPSNTGQLAFVVLKIHVTNVAVSLFYTQVTWEGTLKFCRESTIES